MISESIESIAARVQLSGSDRLREPFACRREVRANRPSILRGPDPVDSLEIEMSEHREFRIGEPGLGPEIPANLTTPHLHDGLESLPDV